MSKQQKYSRKREAMLRLMQDTDCHPPAEWVYEQLKREIPDLSLGTVYRNLALFRRNGDIVPVCVVDGQERFDADKREHGHLICTQCGTIYDFELTEKTVVEQQVLESSRFEPVRRSVIYYGKCVKCPI